MWLIADNIMLELILRVMADLAPNEPPRKAKIIKIIKQYNADNAYRLRSPIPFGAAGDIYRAAKRLTQIDRSK
jgi:hypothetical protein